MPGARHRMRCRTVWEARPGETTAGGTFSREHAVTAEGKPPLAMSAAPAFSGDASRHNPEELFVMALSSCQMLTYLWLAARAGIDVRSYSDEAEGILEPGPAVEGRRRMKMTQVTLRPRIVVAAGTDMAHARALVETAHAECFIAASVSCEVITRPEVILV
jgi:organic hydroperoxide reductase OsmC/OhrA